MDDFDFGGDNNGQVAEETQQEGYQGFDQDESFGGQEVQQEEQQVEQQEVYDHHQEEALYDQQVQQYQSNPQSDAFESSTSASFNFIRFAVFKNLL